MASHVHHGLIQPARTHQGEEARLPAQHQHEVTLRRLRRVRHRQECRERRAAWNAGAILAASPPEHYRIGCGADDPIEKDVVFDTVRAVRHDFPLKEKPRVEVLAVMPREVLLDRPVEVFEIRRPGAPFEMMPELVSQRLPRLLAPIESGREVGEGRERAVVQDDTALHRLGAAVGA